MSDMKVTNRLGFGNFPSVFKIKNDFIQPCESRPALPNADVDQVNILFLPAQYSSKLTKLLFPFDLGPHSTDI